MKISEGQISLMVETAGDCGSVTENTQLITKTVAEYLLCALCGAEIRPVEFVAVFQKDPISKGDTSSDRLPWLWKHCFQHLQDLFVQQIRAALIPQTQNDDFLSFRGFGKGKTAADIVLKRNRQVIGFKGMEGNVDFMQGRGGQEGLTLLFEQSSVCGQDHTKTCFSRKVQKL